MDRLKRWGNWTYYLFLGLISYWCHICLAQDCEEPSITNGRFAGDATEGGTAAVICSTGYEGGGTATCSGGDWTVLPPCTAKACPDNPPPNSQIYGELFYEGTANVTCDAGYEGGGTAICGSNNQWTQLPGCTAVDCGPTGIANGFNAGDSDFGGSPFILCDSGYDGGGDELTCLEDKSWDIRTNCTAKDCGDPSPPNGYLDGERTFSGTATIKCNPGYEGEGPATCLATGNWDTLPTCTPKDCGQPTNQDIPHGSLTGDSSTEYSGSATISCDPGYTGGGTATCLDTGLWDTDNFPPCNPVDCGPPTVDHGSYTGNTVFDGTTTITCNLGYEGGGAATCLDTGTWLTLPTCNPVDCGTLTITNGFLTITSDNFYTGSATVNCDAGYELAGSDVATCLATGNWDMTTLPICNPKDCGPLTDPVHGTVSAPTTTFQSEATYTCESLWQLTGSNTRTCDENGAWVPAAPICADIDCPGLTPPADGSISPPSQVTVGTTVIVACNNFYTLFGDEVIQCETGGTWNATIGTCRRDCPFRTTPANGKLSTSIVIEGTVLDIECNTGYTLDGADQMTCQPGGTWSQFMPVCTENCPTLVDPSHGSLSTNVSSQGTQVTVDCEDKYTLFGATLLICFPTAQWNAAPPTCELDCPSLAIPSNGNIDTLILSKGTEVTYSCNTDYSLFGDSMLTCQDDSSWDYPPPECRKNCPKLSHPANGQLSTLEPRQETVTTASCTTGYTLFGATNLTCQSDANWDFPMPECRIDCQPLTAPNDGNISTIQVSEGTIVDVDCDSGYTLEGADQIICQPGGNWNNIVPVCTEDCQPLTKPSHGSIDTPILSQGTVVTVECDNGYTLFGSKTLICLTSSLWDQLTPTCELNCPQLIPPQNGKLINYAVSIGSVVTYDCNSGYTRFGDLQLTCLPSSTWDLTPPVCKQNCPTLTWPANGKLSTLDPRQGTVSTASCFTDYTLFGATNLTCQSDATWDFAMPECKRDCPGLTDPSDGLIYPDDEVKQGTEVTVDCNDTFTLFGASLLTCQNDATWDNPLPSCREDCPTLSIPTNGYLNNTATRSQGTVISVSCNAHYTLFGEDILTCQPDATWDFLIPDCKEDCPRLIKPANSIMNTTRESQGTVVWFECEPDYTLFGYDVLLCQSDATWDKQAPVCKKDCRALITPTNGIKDNYNVSQDTVVVFSCNFDYTLFGTTTVICQSDATWNNTEPTCEKDCPTLDIAHSTISTNVVIKETVVNVTCDDKYSLEGVSELTCVENGLWDFPIPLCTQDCPKLDNPTNGSIKSEAVSQGSAVPVECDTNFTLFGESVLTCQKNAQWDYPVPTCRIDCPVLTIPSNAIFSTMKKHEGVFLTISCDSGFTRFGNKNISCLPGGFWDRSLPVCKEDCPTLVIPPFGSLDTLDVKEGTIVNITCDPNYTLIGDVSVECLPGGDWDKYLPDCDRNCGPLAAPLNGLVSFVDGTTLNKKAGYACYTGYDLSHDVTRVCRADGSWSGTEPVCIIRDCGSLSIPNGAVTYTNGKTTYKEMATFTCNPGYIRTGNYRRLCRSNTSWSHTSPVCVIKDCGPLANPSSGTVNTASGTTFGEVAKYYCNTGYSLVGSSQRTCNSDGQWEGLPPVCEINDCGVLPKPSNGEVTFSSTVYNMIAYYSCHAGYDRVGVPSRVCQQDAAWSASAPTCVIKDCGTLLAPNRGNVSYSNDLTTFGEVAVFVCEEGYGLVGNENRSCQANGKWEGTLPSCKIKDCGPLPNPAHGAVNYASGTTFGKIANYFCNFGYTITGVTTRQCQSNGNWSDESPTCQINDCGNLASPANGAVSTSRTTYNEIATYTCDSGYHLVGVSQRICRQDKTWSDEAPTCQIRDCGSPFNIGHGTFITPIGTEYNASAIYSCDSNYGLVGSDAILCLPSGYWDSPPSCNLDCGPPTPISNGVFLLQTDTLSGAIATYSCLDGYELVGDPNVTCRISGAWEAPPHCDIIPQAYQAECYVTAQCITSRSTCRSDRLGAIRCMCAETGEIYNATTDACLSDCGFLVAPTNGYIVLPTVPAEGQNVEYSCNVGYALNNVSLETRVCLETGQWSGTAPLCILGCPIPIPPNNGAFQTPEGTAAGRFVHYSCDSGYALVGSKFRECLTSTKWKGDAPLCLKECPLLGSIAHGIVDHSDGNWFKSIATYYCEKDYALVGTATRVCEASGTWTGAAPDCIYAIFPDVLLAIASVLIFLVIVDVFVVLIIVYIRYKKKKEKDEKEPKAVTFDDIDEPKMGENQVARPVTPVEKPDAGIAVLGVREMGPGRSSFRKQENIQVASETQPKAIPQLPRKKKSVMHRIPKPNPLKKLRRPRFFGSEIPMAPNPTPRTIPNSAMDEFADEKIAEMERYLKDDFGTPSSSDANRRSTADEEKVSIDHVTSSRLMTGDKVVLMEFDADLDELPTTRLEEPPKSGLDVGKEKVNLKERKKLQIATDIPDTLRPHTPILPHIRQSDA